MDGTWRQASREEIQRYYTETFPERIDELPAFIRDGRPKQYALSFRNAHPVIGSAPNKDFIRRHTAKTNGDGETVGWFFPTFDEVLSFIQRPGYVDPYRDANKGGLVDPSLVDDPDPVPDAVYYGVESWTHNWPLVFDIDAKDIARREHQIGFGKSNSGPSTLEETPVVEAAPAGYEYEFKHIDAAISIAFDLESFCTDVLGGEQTHVVYSGQGAHVYLVDTDSEYRYDEQTREEIKYYLHDVKGLPIDTTVTSDRSRVMRLPWSLHSDVGRIVMPISSREFDFQSDAQPPFLTIDE